MFILHTVSKKLYSCEVTLRNNLHRFWISRNFQRILSCDPETLNTEKGQTYRSWSKPAAGRTAGPRWLCRRISDVFELQPKQIGKLTAKTSTITQIPLLMKMHCCMASSLDLATWCLINDFDDDDDDDCLTTFALVCLKLAFSISPFYRSLLYLTFRFSRLTDCS